jgi:methyl-accepting chemotaxis protein
MKSSVASERTSMTESEAPIEGPRSDASGSSLRRRIIVSAALIVVATLATLAWAGSSGIGSIFRREADMRVRDIAQRSAVLAERMLSERRREMQLLATSPNAIDAARLGSARAEKLGLEREPVDALEKRFNDNRTLDSDPRFRRYLSSLQGQTGAIEAILTDRWGHNIAITSQTQDFMQGDEAWWQTAAANGTTPPHAEFDDWSKQVVLTMSSAVRDPATQQVIGVLKLTYGMTRTDSSLARGRGNSGGIEVELLDADGNVIASSGETPRMRLFVGAREALLADDSVRTYTSGGKPAWVTSAPVGTDGWRVVAHVPAATALLEAHRVERYLSIATALFGLLLLVGLWFLDRFVTTRITRPTVVLAAAAERVAAGDLSVEIEHSSSNDEIGRLSRATATMIRELRRLATALRATSSETAAMASEITSGAAAMATTAEAMATSSSDLSEQSGTMSQALVQFANDSTKLVAISAELDSGSQEGVERNVALRELAVQNRERLDEAAVALDTLSADVSASVSAADSLVQASEEIRAFVTFVQKMARQSKLLALNAAMEAARAGTHGQGFAVVASEVRRLAAGAAEAAEKTETLVREVLNRVEESRSTTERTVAAVQTVTSATRQGLESFALIESAVAENEAWMEAISQSSTQTHALIGEMTVRLESVSKTTENFAASMEEVAASSEEQSASTAEIADVARALARSAEELARLVASFRLDDPAAVPAPPAGTRGVPSIKPARTEQMDELERGAA